MYTVADKDNFQYYTGCFQQYEKILTTKKRKYLLHNIKGKKS